MGKPKFYRSKHNPTISLDRSWAQEADEIDALLREHCGSHARWTRIFAFGDIANRIYYLYKRGHKSFLFNKIKFRYLGKDTYTVVLMDNVKTEAKQP